MPKADPDDKGLSFQEDRLEDDEIEILEVIGLDEDSPGAGHGSAEIEPEPEEFILTLEDDDEELPFQKTPVETEPALEVAESRPAEAPDEPRLTEATPPVGLPAADEDEDDGSDREALVRLQADFENYKKRIEREMEAQRRHASASLVGRLLEVLDNFERAVSVVPQSDSDRAFRDGVVLIFKQLLEELRKEGLAAIDSIGEPFDPSLHEAVATDSESAFPPHTVVEEMQRGYLLHDRLLRPSLVKVRIDTEDRPVVEQNEEEA